MMRERFPCVFIIFVIIISCTIMPVCTAHNQIPANNAPDSIVKTQVIFANFANGTSSHWINTSAGSKIQSVFSSPESSKIPSSTKKTPDYVPGQVIVKFKPSVSTLSHEGQRNSSQLHAKIGVSAITPLDGAGIGDVQIVNLPENISVDSAIAFYRQDSGVQYVQPNYQYSFVKTPDDPLLSNQWGLSKPDNTVFTKGGINAPDAWNITTGSNETIIALVDSGVDYTHPDLAENIWNNIGETGPDSLGRDKRSNGIDDDNDGFIDDWNGWNFYFNTSDVMDYEGHGTHCAGIIGAVGNNGRGVCGVNWQVKIMPVAVSDNHNHIDTQSAVKGFSYAIHHGAKIISCSWGGYDADPLLQEMIADNPDILFIFAAGNDANNNDFTPFYPASYTYDNIISVAAVSDGNDGFAGFSNYGYNSVDIAAPGENILSTYLSTSGNYTYLSGTSMAAPHVAGVAGLIQAKWPDLNSVRVKDYLLQSAEKKSAYTGYVKSGGRLNAFNVLRSLSVPVVDFSADVTAGSAPLTVHFTDLSYANILSRSWDFGEGNVSNEQNPSFTYQNPGSYTVTLTATNKNGSAAATKTKYIRVTIPPTSDVGKNWTLATGAAEFPGRAYHTSVAYNGKMWVIGGFDNADKYNDVWYSAEGINWTRATESAAFSPRFVHSSVVHSNRMWVIGGGEFGEYNNDVWYSADGINWIRATGAAPFAARSMHTSVEYNGKIWVIGGRISGNRGSNDVWYSADGINWTEATGAAAFPVRWGHSAVVYDNRMWVIGGWSGADDGGIFYNDVWYSSDGINWTQATSAAAFSPRYGHSSLEYDGKIWVLGSDDLNDVWYSYDGDTWTQVTENAAFPAREGFKSVVHNRKMWVIGGYKWSPKNDIWYSSVPLVPEAGFRANATSGSVPLTVEFLDQSTENPTAWLWNFGDGNTSTLRNPVHTYSSAGTYTVSLNATNANGSNTSVRADYITSYPPIKPLPGFIHPPTDPDRDGIYEDLNGNNRLDFADVVLYFNQMEWIAANEPVRPFDLNGNSRIDFADIVRLFGEI